MNRDRLDQVRLAMMVINAAKEKPETTTEVMALVERVIKKLGLNY